jgi:hypothetical protein
METDELAQNREKPKKKKKGGKGRPFGPGNRANPGGRPKSQEANEIIRAMFKEQGEKVVKNLYALCYGKDKRLRLAAITAVLDRVLGRPLQAIEHSGGLDIQTLTKEERQARIDELMRKRVANGG